MLSYLAGFFDGEGCVSRAVHRYGGKDGRQREYVTHTLICSQNDRSLCDLFIETFGIGHVYEIRPGHHQWRANNHDAAVVARKLAPYLRLKRSKAESLVAAVTAATQTTVNSVVDKLVKLLSVPDLSKPYSASWGNCTFTYTP